MITANIVGPSCLIMSWGTSNRPQNHVGNYLDPLFLSQSTGDFIFLFHVIAVTENSTLGDVI